jgi:hypothetical protein
MLLKLDGHEIASQGQLISSRHLLRSGCFKKAALGRKGRKFVSSLLSTLGQKLLLCIALLQFLSLEELALLQFLSLKEFALLQFLSLESINSYVASIIECCQTTVQLKSDICSLLLFATILFRNQAVKKISITFRTFPPGRGGYEIHQTMVHAKIDER